MTRRTRFQILPFLVLGLAATQLAWAQSGENVTYPNDQPTKSWQGRAGNFSISGKAIRRQGNYVEFRTNRNFEIWLPIHYLTPTDVSYLEQMKGGSVPLVSADTDTASPPSGFGGMPATSDTSSTGTDETSAATTDSVAEAKPPIVRPEAYDNGDYIEVEFNGKWFRGHVRAVNLAKGRYWVSFQDGPIPRSEWFEHDKTRPLPTEEPKDDADATDAPMDSGESL